MFQENFIHDSLPNMVAKSEKYDHLKPQGTELMAHVTVDKYSDQNVFYSEQSDLCPVQTSQNLNPYQLSSSQQFSPNSALPNHEKKEYLNKNQTSFSTNIKCPKPYISSSYNQIPENSEKSSSFMLPNDNVILKTPSSFLNKNNITHGEKNNNENVIDSDKNYDKNLNKIIGKSIPNQIDKFQSCDNNVTNDNKEKGVEERPKDAQLLTDSLAKFKNLNISIDQVPFTPVQETNTIQKKPMGKSS